MTLLTHANLFDKHFKDHFKMLYLVYHFETFQKQDSNFSEAKHNQLHLLRCISLTIPGLSVERGNLFQVNKVN